MSQEEGRGKGSPAGENGTGQYPNSTEGSGQIQSMSRADRTRDGQIVRSWNRSGSGEDYPVYPADYRHPYNG